MTKSKVLGGVFAVLACVAGAAERTFRLTDFGARPDGSKSTAAFAAAIGAAHAAGGGRVEVPAGSRARRLSRRT